MQVATYENIFEHAARIGATSIALPGISTGSRGCPPLTAAVRTPSPASRFHL